MGCSVCGHLEIIKNEATGPELFEHAYSPECTSLVNHGFVIIRNDLCSMPNTTTDAYNSEI